ncbi:MAG: hypothetical protein R3C03_09800 [Pirellulaceae bacterium]
MSQKYRHILGFFMMLPAILTGSFAGVLHSHHSHAGGECHSSCGDSSSTAANQATHSGCCCDHESNSDLVVNSDNRSELNSISDVFTWQLPSEHSASGICIICQFLATHVLADLAEPIVHEPERVCELISIHQDVQIVDVSLAYHCRGPPAV